LTFEFCLVSLAADAEDMKALEAVEKRVKGAKK